MAASSVALARAWDERIQRLFVGIGSPPSPIKGDLAAPLPGTSYEDETPP